MRARTRLVRLVSPPLALAAFLATPTLAAAQDPEPQPAPAFRYPTSAHRAEDVTGVQGLLPVVGATGGFADERYGATVLWSNQPTVALRTSLFGGQVALGLTADRYDRRLKEPALMLGYGRRLGRLQLGEHLTSTLGIAAGIGHEWRSRVEWNGTVSPAHTAATLALPLVLAWDMRGRGPTDSVHRRAFSPTLRVWGGPRVTRGWAGAMTRQSWDGTVDSMPAGQQSAFAIDFGMRLDGLGPVGLELGLQRSRGYYRREWVNNSAYLGLTFGW